MVMLWQKIHLKNIFLFVKGRSDQLKFKSWTSKLKRCCSNILWKISCDSVKKASNDVQASFYLAMQESLRFGQYPFKCYHQFYNNFKSKMLVGVVFKRFQPHRPLWTFAAAAYSFSWEENGISNDDIQK